MLSWNEFVKTELLFLFAFNASLAELTSILWIIILHEYKPLTHTPRSCWDRVMLQYAMIASLIQFAILLMQIPDFPIGKNTPNYKKNYALWLVWYGVAAILPTLCHTQTLLFDPKISNFDSSVQRTFFPPLFCPVFVHLGSMEPFASSTTVSWLQFYHIGQLHRVFSQWMLTDFFTTLVQLSSDVWRSQPSFTRAGDSDEIVLCSCCFWTISSTFGLVLSCFLMSLNSIIHYSSVNFFLYFKA